MRIDVHSHLVYLPYLEYLTDVVLYLRVSFEAVPTS